MSEYGAQTILHSTGVDIELLSIAATFYCSRCRHYSTFIAENNENPKLQWKTFKRILHKSLTFILPDHISPSDLDDTFGHFLATKL